MRIYSVQGPDGRIYDIEGPDNATDQQVIGALQQYLNQQATPAPTPTPPQEENTIFRQALDVPVPQRGESSAPGIPPLFPLIR